MILYLSLFSKYQACNKSLSLLIINTPLGFNPSRISSLAFNIFSLLQRFVITATSGFAIFVKYDISFK